MNLSVPGTGLYFLWSGTYYTYSYILRVYYVPGLVCCMSPTAAVDLLHTIHHLFSVFLRKMRTRYVLRSTCYLHYYLHYNLKLVETQGCLMVSSANKKSAH